MWINHVQLHSTKFSKLDSLLLNVLNTEKSLFLFDLLLFTRGVIPWLIVPRSSWTLTWKLFSSPTCPLRARHPRAPLRRWCRFQFPRPTAPTPTLAFLRVYREEGEKKQKKKKKINTQTEIRNVQEGGRSWCSKTKKKSILFATWNGSGRLR